MKPGDYVRTPRFLNVRIEEVFDNMEEARDAGYTETTHYRDDPNYGILGKSIGLNRMKFAAFRK